MMNASYFSDLPNDFLVISLAKCLFFTITESNGSTLGKDKDVSNYNYHYHINILNTFIITKVIIKYDTVEVSRTWLVMETWPPMYVLIMITFIDKYTTKRCKKTVITLVEYFWIWRKQISISNNTIQYFIQEIQIIIIKIPLETEIVRLTLCMTVPINKKHKCHVQPKNYLQTVIKKQYQLFSRLKMIKHTYILNKEIYFAH